MNNTGTSVSPIHVYSEIGPLKKVLLHQPGKELENLMPEYLERLLFDDIPYLKVAQEEHRQFAQILKQNGVEVVYLTQLLEESLHDDAVRQAFTKEFVAEAGIRDTKEKDLLADFFGQMPLSEMIAHMIAGVRKSELNRFRRNSLGDLLNLINDDYPFVMDPIPNLYFTRDPFASVGNGVSIHRMHTPTRNRETLFAKYIFRYNPIYKNTKVWYDRTEDSSVEGGDILVLNPKTIAVGISQRTHENAVQRFAEALLTEEGGFEKILAFNIPKERSFMHLDTVFTMVDYGKFTIHPNILRGLDVFVLERGKDGHIHITHESGTLEDILKQHLKLDRVTLIKCGSGHVIDSSREQWNDGSNTLAIAPGHVIVYSRNYLTNEILQENGITTHIMPSSELSRGRGGPRCMSMPLLREDINL